MSSDVEKSYCPRDLSQCRVYIAGGYDGKDTQETQHNRRLGIRTAATVLLAGLTPITGFIHTEYSLVLRSGEFISQDMYRTMRLSLFSACHCVLVVNEHKESEPPVEVLAAYQWGMPIFYDLGSLLEWAKGEGWK